MITVPKAPLVMFPSKLSISAIDIELCKCNVPEENVYIFNFYV